MSSQPAGHTPGIASLTAISTTLCGMAGLSASNSCPVSSSQLQPLPRPSRNVRCQSSVPRAPQMFGGGRCGHDHIIRRWLQSLKRAADASWHVSQMMSGEGASQETKRQVGKAPQIGWWLGGKPLVPPHPWNHCAHRNSSPDTQLRVGADMQPLTMKSGPGTQTAK